MIALIVFVAVLVGVAIGLRLAHRERRHLRSLRMSPRAEPALACYLCAGTRTVGMHLGHPSACPQCCRQDDGGEAA